MVCIAGSLRRGKTEVGDIEILFVPRSGPVHTAGALFPQQGSLADELIEQWLRDHMLTKRLIDKNAVPTWGPLNKLAVHVASGVPVDLFATTHEHWWSALVMRTGPKETNVSLAAAAPRLKFHAYGAFTRLDTGAPVIPRSESEVFAGLPWREPADR